MLISIRAAIVLASVPSIFAWSLSWPFSWSKIEKRDVLEKRQKTTLGLTLDSTCGTGSQAEMFRYFNGIFFGDFITSNSQGSDRALAVQGRFQGDTYTVNQHGSPVCPSEDILAATGLVVGGTFDAKNIHVFGDSYLSDGSTTSGVEEQVSGCSTYNDRGLGGFKFSDILEDVNVIQVLYALRHPTLVLDANHVLRRVREPLGGLDVITFDTCDGGCTTFFRGYLSDPRGMLYGENNWNGPQGMQFPSNLIINIPVNQGSSITFTGNLISSGLQGCSTLWNIYPTSGSGYYLTGAPFTIYRNTGGRLNGFVLAPFADIVDGPTASFAGQIIANNYRWASTGVFLNDYGSCSFSLCLPIINVDPITVDPPLPPPPFVSPNNDLVDATIPDILSDSVTLPSDFPSDGLPSSTVDSESITGSSSSDSEPSSEEQSSSDNISSDSSQSSENSSDSISSDSSISSENSSESISSDSSVISESSENSGESESLSNSSESESSSDIISSESSEASESSSISISSDSSVLTESTESSSNSISSISSDSSEISESSSESESSSSESSVESDSSSSIESESISSVSESESISSSSDASLICSTEYHHHHHHHTKIDCDHGEEEHQHDVVYCEYDDHYHDDSEDCEPDEEIIVCENPYNVNGNAVEDFDEDFDE